MKKEIENQPITLPMAKIGELLFDLDTAYKKLFVIISSFGEVAADSPLNEGIVLILEEILTSLGELRESWELAEAKEVTV